MFAQTAAKHKYKLPINC